MQASCLLLLCSLSVGHNEKYILHCDHTHTLFLKPQLIYSVSGIGQSDQLHNACMFLLFHILFHYMLLQDIEYTSLCCTVGPCLFYVQQCVSVNPKLLIYLSSQAFPLFNRKLVFCVCAFCEYIHLCYILDSTQTLVP